MISMTERSSRFRELQEKEFILQQEKGLDYGEEEDGMANLRRRGLRGILGRMKDKMKRMEILLDPNRKVNVSSETFEDTAMDLSNYANLLIIARNDGIPMEEEEES